MAGSITGRTQWGELQLWVMGCPRQAYVETWPLPTNPWQGSRARNEHLTSLTSSQRRQTFASQDTEQGKEEPSLGQERQRKIKQQDHPLCEEVSLGWAVALRRYIRVHGLQGKGVKQTETYILPFCFLYSFVHLERKRCNTSQIQFCKILSNVRWTFLRTNLAIHVLDMHVLTTHYRKFMKIGYCFW